MASLVTVADAILAFPIAYYMARVASPRTRNLLVVAVLTPLWASYLVKAFAWRRCSASKGSSTGCSSRSGSASPGDWIGLWLDIHVLLAPVHDPAHLRGPGADPAVAARGFL